MQKKKLKKIDFLIETSWEVCNKIGGIYTVIASKAPEVKKEFEDRAIYIGPDLCSDEEKNIWFEEDDSLYTEWKKQAKEKDSIQVKIGRWNIPGTPIVILVKFDKLFEDKNIYYKDMWSDFGVDSIDAYGDYDESCMFSIAAAKTIESFCKYQKLQKKKVVAQFHEWTTGMGLLYVKKNMPSIVTSFTTHATTVGRSIAGNGKPLYSEFKNYNGDQMARELNVVAKHSLEKKAAEFADCFTTVSEITAKECEQFLDKTPTITPNGIDSSWIPNSKSYASKRKIARSKLIQVAEALFGYKLSKDVFILGTSGRYEFRNKGIDLFIESLKVLNKNDALKKEILAFIMVPAWVKEPRKDLLDKLQNEDKGGNMLPNPFISHELYNENQDIIVNNLRCSNFLNNKNDKVKIVFVPSYLNGNDGIFNMSYYDLLIGLDLTLFPSYYEPWGYTPQESIAFSVPTLTTNLAGFGKWTKDKVSHSEEDSETVVVNERTDYNFHHESIAFSDEILKKTLLKSKEIQALKKNALKMSQKTTWDNFFIYYLEAYQNGLKKN